MRCTGPTCAQVMVPNMQTSRHTANTTLTSSSARLSCTYSTIIQARFANQEVCFAYGTGCNCNRPYPLPEQKCIVSLLPSSSEIKPGIFDLPGDLGLPGQTETGIAKFTCPGSRGNARRICCEPRLRAVFHPERVHALYAFLGLHPL